MPVGFFYVTHPGAIAQIQAKTAMAERRKFKTEKLCAELELQRPLQPIYSFTGINKSLNGARLNFRKHPPYRDIKIKRLFKIRIFLDLHEPQAVNAHKAFP